MANYIWMASLGASLCQYIPQSRYQSTFISFGRLRYYTVTSSGTELYMEETVQCSHCAISLNQIWDNHQHVSVCL